MVMNTTQTPGYPHFQSSSGMCLKFIPYMPATNVSGMKIAEKMVSIFMTSLSLLLTLERYIQQAGENVPVCFYRFDNPHYVVMHIS
jgi:hypothetical protein